MSQEKYDYVILSKQDFMKKTEEGDSASKTKTRVPEFSVDAFNTELSKRGDDGFRVITKLYNGDGDWLLILSKPIYVPNPVGDRGSRIRS